MTTRKKPESAADAVDEQLARYRSMRDFGITAEPSGDKRKVTKSDLPFCVQKHAASHLHYDFRLGWNGVLKSWACAKGPSYNVKDKRLAVQVEDHPIEYGGFEGIIPQGQYGGGTVMLWDQGTWEPQAESSDVDKALRDGMLKFILHGTKLKGKWALIRMGGKAASERKPNWLLIKEHDEFERKPDDPAITDEEPRSVITNRDIDQIAHNEDHVWNSKETAKGNAWIRQEPKSATFDVSSLPKESQPAFIEPQLAKSADNPPEGASWIHELKLDGYRVQARKSGANVKLLTRSGLDWTARMPAIAVAVAALPAKHVTLDGEVVVLAENGTTSFADLQASFQEGAKHTLTYFVFDLLHVDGRNLRGQTLLERKRLLEQILDSADSEVLRFSEHLVSGGSNLFHKACELSAEGIVSKLADGKYHAGRSGEWLKVKCLLEQEFVIGGFTLPSDESDGIGALLLGYYEGKHLIYAGRSGTGFTRKSGKTIRKQLEALRKVENPFQKVPADARRGAIWVKPALVAQVRFATWTADQQVRQAAFLGLREDKAASEVVKESAGPKPKASPQAKTSASHRVSAAKAAFERAPVRLTHPDKLLDRESGVTKQMLADYLWAVAARMLTHVAGRPLSLVRCPEGVEGERFFQKHVTKTLPAGIGSVDVPNGKTGVKEAYITLDSAEALASLAQMSVLEIHPWGSRNEDLEHADRLVIDLDPDETLSWTTVTSAAFEVKDFLEELGLESYVKTTGGKGLHVVFAVKPELDWPQIKGFAHALVNALEKRNPKLYLTKMTKSARVGKIYLDYLRNERGATAIAPYSTRARVGVGVAMPLDWSELKAKERPVFALAKFADWQGRLTADDPWELMGKKKQGITKKALNAVGVKS